MTISKFRLVIPIILLSLTGLQGCSDDPMGLFNEQMEKYGYIAYQTPLQYAGTGTLVGGKPDSLSIIAHPQSCFPSEIDGIQTSLRRRDESTLPSTEESIVVEGGARIELFEALQVGSPSISAGTRIKDIHTIQLSFRGVHIEYIDAISLAGFYRNSLSEICKDYLDRVGFIIQAIRIDQMEFRFFRKNQSRIAVGVDNIQEFIDISGDIQWTIERTGSLVIDTPKYIGYQLGALKREDRGLVLQRATSVRFNNFVFESVNIFEKANQQETHEEWLIPRLPEDTDGFLKELYETPELILLPTPST